MGWFSCCVPSSSAHLQGRWSVLEEGASGSEQLGHSPTAHRPGFQADAVRADRVQYQSRCLGRSVSTVTLAQGSFYRLAEVKPSQATNAFHSPLSAQCNFCSQRRNACTQPDLVLFAQSWPRSSQGVRTTAQAAGLRTRAATCHVSVSVSPSPCHVLRRTRSGTSVEGRPESTRALETRTWD